MEMRKKIRKSNVSKVAKRILQNKKKQIRKKSNNKCSDGRIVIDLNVNVTGMK